MARKSVSVNDDYTKFTTNFKPPPPPGEKNQWELQFCRWWGWNWVQKTNLQTNTICEGTSTVPQIVQSEERKVKKKHFKDLCQCLCFKKRPKNAPRASVKKMYRTPSNSRTLICETAACGIIEQDDSGKKKSELQKRVSNKESQKACSIKYSEQSVVKLEKTFSDSDSFTCSGNFRPSSAEDSVQYLKVVCNCCKPEKLEKGKAKADGETQTAANKPSAVQAQTSKCPIRICGTQTAPKKDNKKKRHVTVVCCHCCKCQNNEDLKPQIKSSLCFRKNTKTSVTPRSTVPVFQYNEDRKFPNFKNPGKDFSEIKNNDERNWHETLDQYKPWDTLFSNKHLMSKFGMSRSKNPWIHTTKSDILDQRYRLKIEEEFASPISGKIYKLSPTKIEELKNQFPANLPDPIKVNKNVEYLQKLEQQLKTDLESRAMLDSICDVILYNHETDTKETYMDDFERNFSSCKTIKSCSSKLLQTVSYPYEKHDKNVRLARERSTQSISNINFDIARSFSSHDSFPRFGCESHHYLAENMATNNFTNQEYSVFKKKNYKHDTNPFSQSSSFSKRGSKRSASCAYEGPIKKMKSMHSVDTTETILSNIENLFKKINDIYLDVRGENLNENINNSKPTRRKIENNKSYKLSKSFNTDDSHEYRAIGEKIEKCFMADINSMEDNSSEDICKIHDTFSCTVKVDNQSLSSDSSLFSKIDEIINRSQATENQIQKFVLNLPTKRDESKRDYTCSEWIKCMSPKNSDLSNGLATILESSDETSEHYPEKNSK